MRKSIKLFLLVAAITAQSADSNKPESFRFESDSPHGIYKKAAVAANGVECAQIGSDILKLKKGSAVDAAIATLICEGVACPNSMSLGGGFMMTIYDAPSGKATFLNARETAPILANATMFGGNQELSHTGGLSVAVPGEVLGYWEAHQRYGRIPWKELFEPSVELAERGFLVSSYFLKNLNHFKEAILNEPTLSEIFVNPETNQLYNEGDHIKLPALAKTLRELADAKYPAELFYRGRIANILIKEIQNFGGIITAEDFANYKVKWSSPTVAKLGGLTMYSAPAPGGGHLLSFILNVLKDILPAKSDRIMWQRIIETFKWAYAKRTVLGDPDFANIDKVLAKLLSPEYAKFVRDLILKNDKTHNDPKYYGAVNVNKDDAGTASIAVLAPDGSAVSATSSINRIFGARIRSPSTGIIFNDQMSDFSLPGIPNMFGFPPSPNNFIQPNKRPFSSFAPTIIVDEHGKVVLVISAAGGVKITSALASTIALYLWNDFNIKEAIDAQRMHHQLIPMVIENQNGFPQHILHYLEKLGHRHKPYPGMGSSVTAIAVKNGLVTANSDYRRKGTIAGF